MKRTALYILIRKSFEKRFEGAFVQVYKNLGFFEQKTALKQAKVLKNYHFYVQVAQKCHFFDLVQNNSFLQK